MVAVTELRKQGTVERIPKPTNLKRARALGYTAKQGVVVLQVRVHKGQRKRPLFKGGRRPKARGRFYPPDKSKRQRAEERGARKYPNLEVLNSYSLAEDGQFAWFEVLLVDMHHPRIKEDHALKNLGRGRVFRGLTSAGKKSRGLRK